MIQAALYLFLVTNTHSGILKKIITFYVFDRKCLDLVFIVKKRYPLWPKQKMIKESYILYSQLNITNLFFDETMTTISAIMRAQIGLKEETVKSTFLSR